MALEGSLRAGRYAWSYDAYEGAIVTETKAICPKLSRISDHGAVGVRLDLKAKNSCVFVVDGKETPAILLPAGSTIVPSACLLKKGQIVTLRKFRTDDTP